MDQRRFVDRPQVAVVEADDQTTHVMADRGYPVADFESQSELVSVDHPDLVQNYRDAHGTYTKTTTGEASTEDLRRAVIAYRALFEELSPTAIVQTTGAFLTDSSSSDKGHASAPQTLEVLHGRMLAFVEAPGNKSSPVSQYFS